MIQITGLTKVHRRGRPPALLDLTFDARPGVVTALLGDAGAGKTTALRLMVELERGLGITLFDGRTYRSIRRPEREIGVMLPSARPTAGHPGQRARSHLRMLAGSVGLPARRADELLEQARLAAVAEHRLRAFSPGMNRRLALAAALLGDPNTLLLDAPTEGLSPRNEEWFHAFCRSFAVAGGTVVVTTRSPQEAASLADRVVTLDRGRLVADQPVAEFRRTRLHPEVAVRGPQMARLADLLTGQGAQVRRDGGAGLAVSGIGRTEIGELAYRHGILLHELADRVVEQPVPHPSLPSGSGRSGHVLVRGRDRRAAEPVPAARPEPATELLSPVGREEPLHEPVPAAVVVGRPAEPEPEHAPDPVPQHLGAYHPGAHHVDTHHVETHHVGAHQMGANPAAQHLGPQPGAQVGQQSVLPPTGRFADQEAFPLDGHLVQAPVVAQTPVAAQTPAATQTPAAAQIPPAAQGQAMRPERPLFREEPVLGGRAEGDGGQPPFPGPLAGH